MVRIATRRSPLARWQAEWVQARLQEQSIDASLVLLTSEGDVQRQPIDGSQPVGLFTKRIQQAVLEGQADIAVHSLKDLPTQRDTGMHLAAVPARAPVADCLVTREAISFEELPHGALVGTGSRRRAAQLLWKRPDLRVEPIRGNVQTRLNKLDEGFIAVILAQAGLERLGTEGYHIAPLETDWMLPAAGQGALGLEVRQADVETASLLRSLHCPSTMASVAAERHVLRTLRAGCLAPVGVLASLQGCTELVLRACVLSVDGKERLFAEGRASLPASLEEGTDPSVSVHGVAIAESLAEGISAQLLASGAGPLIEAAR